jgi:predicted outer membrane repeat protein
MSDSATVSGNKINGHGGGVYVRDHSSFTMKDSAKISSNTATISGGGVHVGLGSFTMSGNATVSGNTAGTFGGGVYAFSYNNINFTKTGGVIYGSNETNPALRNTAKNREGVEQTDQGAAVYVDSTHRRETTVGVAQNLSKTSDGTYTGQWTD